MSVGYPLWRLPMKNPVTGIILVGHGAVPSDFPRELVVELKSLEGARTAQNALPSPREQVLDRKIRTWPRTPRNDPYVTGLESLAKHLRPFLDGALLAVAYNEFCVPSLEGAIEELSGLGVTRIIIVPSMLTPGGVHSEKEIPATIERLKTRYPSISFHYAWPFDMGSVAGMLAGHLKPFR